MRRWARRARDLVAPVEFEFTGKRRTRLWLVLKEEEASVCLKPPGFDADLLVRADLGAFY